MLFGIQEPVSAAIWHLLDNYCITDAIFLSERLHAEVASEESAFLLATSYYRSGQVIRAMRLLEKMLRPTPKCRLLLARCYLQQKEYAKVQHILLDNTCLSMEQLPRLYQTDTGVAFWLVAESLRRSNISEDAQEYLLLSLQYNPYLWSSLEALCERGHAVPLEDIYVAENCPVFCSEAPYMAVSRYIPDKPAQIREDTDTRTNIASLVPPPDPEVPKKKNLSKVCMKLSFDFVDKKLPRKPTDANIGSPATPTFGTLPLISTPDLEERGTLERSGNVSWLINQLKDTHLFFSTNTPSPQPSARDSSLTKAPLIKKKYLPTYKEPQPSVIRSLLEPDPASSFASPDPLPQRHTRKRDLKNAPPASDETEPRHKIMRPEQIADLPRYDRPVTRSFFRQEVPPLSSLLLSNPTLPDCSDSKLPLPSKLPLRSRVRAEQSRPRSSLLHSLPAPETSPGPPADTSMLLDPGQTEQFNSALVSSLQSVVSLLLQLARAYTLLSRYDCPGAVEAFQSLPEHQLRTPWVLCQLAKAHFERANYQASCGFFEKARLLDPDHVTDMDTYSTALWHLHKDIELSALSEELADSWYLSPQAWCAKGNCLSMHKEHEDAIKFFQRATQVSPRFVYAYTLLGHEYLCTEDLTSARKNFRKAATINPRHYNAFFGLGMISLREENYEMAEMNFKRAFAINSSSCVICSRLAKVKHSLNRPSEALLLLEKARKLDPKNPVPLYHRATIMFDLNRPQEALEILEELVRIAPREALVHFLMGKVFQKLGKKYEAKLKYSWALSIDPNNREIRDAQNTLNQPSSTQEECTPPNSRFDIFIDPMPEAPTPDENNNL